MITEFKLLGEEIKLAEEFEAKHANCEHAHPTTIGGGLEYIFTPNAIGRGVSIKCLICGETKNITDYDLW